MAKGLDVGTSFVVLAQDGEGDSVVYKDFRDAFYTIKPSSPVALKMIEKGLQGRIFVKDADGNWEERNASLALAEQPYKLQPSRGNEA